MVSQCALLRRTCRLSPESFERAFARARVRLWPASAEAAHEAVQNLQEVFKMTGGVKTLTAVATVRALHLP